MKKFHFMDQCIHPTEIEKDNLNALYSRFNDVLFIIIDPDFSNKEPSHRLFYIKELFSIYTECNKYDPIRIHIESNDFLGTPCLEWFA